MRIATSTIYENQVQSIDNLSSQYQNIGQTLSTGKSLNVPSDDPAQISQDLTLTSTIAGENSDASNASAAQNLLTFTDSTLSGLTSLLQTARSLTVEGATDIIPNHSQRPLIGQQIAGLLNQALALANTQYGGTYLFAGTGSGTTPPITALGSPPNAVAFSGNNQARTEVINGQTVTVGTTLQQAFNQGSTNGTPSVFQLLATLRNTMDNEPASIQSQQPINVTGQVIQGVSVVNGVNVTDANPTTLVTIAGPPAMTTIPLTPDNGAPPSYSIEIDGTNPATAAPGKAVFTFTAANAVDDGIVGGTSVVQQINATDQRDRRARRLERRIATAPADERGAQQSTVPDLRRVFTRRDQPVDVPRSVSDPQPSQRDQQPVHPDRGRRRRHQPGAPGADKHRAANPEPGGHHQSSYGAFER